MCRPSDDFSELCGDRKIVDMTAQGITEYVETSNEDTCIIGTSKLRAKGEGKKSSLLLSLLL